MKLRRTLDTPTRVGTTEVGLGDVVELPDGVARQLLEQEPSGWTRTRSPAPEESATPASAEDVQIPTTTTRRRKPAEE